MSTPLDDLLYNFFYATALKLDQSGAVLPSGQQVMVARQAIRAFVQALHEERDALQKASDDAKAWLWSLYPRAGNARPEVRLAMEALGDRPPHGDEPGLESERDIRDRLLDERDALRSEVERLEEERTALIAENAAVNHRYEQRSLIISDLRAEIERLKKAVSDQAAAYLRLERAWEATGTRPRATDGFHADLPNL